VGSNPTPATILKKEKNMTRKDALKVSNLLYRVEQLESQLDFINTLELSKGGDLENEFLHDTPSFGFLEEDIEDLEKVVLLKLTSALEELEQF
jgi:hypothetical protein